MALERRLDRSHQSTLLPMASRLAEGQAQSLSVSGICMQGDGQTQKLSSSQLNPSFGSPSCSVSVTGWSSLAPSSGEMNRLLNSTTNCGPISGASSAVTDANSAIAVGSRLQRSASISKESYVPLPPSPISFSPNNISISVSPSPILHCSNMTQQDENSQQIPYRQQQHLLQGISSTTSNLASNTGTIPLQMCPELHPSFPMQKKLRLDLSQDHVMQQRMIQQLLQRQDSFQAQRHNSQLQGQNPQLQSLTQQQRLLQLQQQQILQSMPQMQQQRQLLQSVLHPGSGWKQSCESGICSRRLMKYLYHQSQRPLDNNIIYWRKFVAEYFAPRAKKRCCVSLYDTAPQSSPGVFPQSTMEMWHCDICGSKSGRGFEITADILPRLCKIEYDSGVIDDLLFLDDPREVRFPSGYMMLEYVKAVQESVYEQIRVVREGHLRIIFTPDLKILSWLFCARRYEEFFSRRLMAPQVSHLLQVAQKHQTVVNESGSAGTSPQDLHTICNMFASSGRQLVKNMDFQWLNDLGFSKRYVRCLQISEVVRCMKDLMDFSRERKVGPIESLKEFPRKAAPSMLHPQRVPETEQLSNRQGLASEQTNLNRLVALHPGLSSHFNTQAGIRAMNNRAPTAVEYNSYQNMLKQCEVNAGSSSLQAEASGSYNHTDSSCSSLAQGPASLPLGSALNAPINGISGPNQSLQRNHQQPSLSNHQVQQQMIQQMLQEMMSAGGGMQQEPACAQSADANAADAIQRTLNVDGSFQSRIAPDVAEIGSKTADAPTNDDIPAMPQCKIDDVKTVPDNSASTSGSDSRSDVLQNPHFAELLQDMPCEFADSSVFDSELGDIDYCWRS